MDPTSPLAAVEAAVRDVYDYCPPTLTRFGEGGREAYDRFWRGFMTQLGVKPAAFAGRSVLDVGCGSCEKASIYHDWGARVIGIEMTPSVLDLGRQTIGDRDITLVQTSLFEFSPATQFDIVIADGVLHHTADTLAAVRQCATFVRDGGLLIVGLLNVWGTFWWFKPARAITRLIGGSDFHRRARWGQVLFGWTRPAQENASRRSAFLRSPESWAYDWFGNPTWNVHGPGEVRRWLTQLDLELVGSVPALDRKPAGSIVAPLRMLSGSGPRFMALAWLLSRQQNMLYVCARKRSAS